MSDSQYMLEAIELAKKGRTSPNPKVGCVIVKDAEIIGQGYHLKAGEDHAEIIAIQDALQKTQDLTGATMYLTLEPCCATYPGKRKPPCTDAILNSGITKVIIAMIDPNPRVKGAGIEFLKKSGILVEQGLLEQEAKEINLPYIKWTAKKMPYVAIKMAMSLDGKIATNSGDSKWISCEESRKLVHEMRDQFDAVMVGAGTVKKDDPELTCRLKDGHNPYKIIIDSDLCIDPESKFMKNIEEKENVIIATSKNAKDYRVGKLQEKGARIIIAGEHKVNLKKLMAELAQLNIQSVLIEGGSELNASAIELGIVDKIYFFIAPKIIGGRDAKGPVGGIGIRTMKEALNLKNMNIKQIGEDFLIEAEL